MPKPLSKIQQRRQDEAREKSREDRKIERDLRKHVYVVHQWSDEFDDLIPISYRVPPEDLVILEQRVLHYFSNRGWKSPITPFQRDYLPDYHIPFKDMVHLLFQIAADRAELKSSG